MQMKRIIVCVVAMCLAVMAVAQKPKRMFSTEKPPFAGVTWQDGRVHGGTTHIRLNLALPLSRVKEAFDRLDKYVFNP